jgi:hypothetical protein
MSTISTYLRKIARLGGLSKSAAKSAAARANGKKGGRPRKDTERRADVDHAHGMPVYPMAGRKLAHEAKRRAET